ncbi:hypothetical protein KFE25_014159 [Diacronema lutheri]|uniref:Uncharacterized protein n=1 Tax=Diacronema lutheri TaxID=2081491 RepID=A0A8J5X8N7_DIALT|nr:hypothetical protein KFE25_014159 [Diacronema lutheri]
MPPTHERSAASPARNGAGALDVRRRDPADDSLCSIDQRTAVRALCIAQVVGGGCILAAHGTAGFSSLVAARAGTLVVSGMTGALAAAADSALGANVHVVSHFAYLTLEVTHRSLNIVRARRDCLTIARAASASAASRGRDGDAMREQVFADCAVPPTLAEALVAAALFGIGLLIWRCLLRPHIRRLRELSSSAGSTELAILSLHTHVHRHKGRHSAPLAPSALSRSAAGGAQHPPAASSAAPVRSHVRARDEPPSARGKDNVTPWAPCIAAAATCDAPCARRAAERARQG